MANPRTVRKLRDAAQKAVGKGRYDKALDSYHELEQLEPETGDWSRRVGEMHRYLEQPERAIAAFTRAAGKYSHAGFLLKAVAVCKMILRLDPSHSDTQALMSSFNSARGIELRPEVASPQVAAPALAPVEAIELAPEPKPIAEHRRTSVPPGMGLDAVALREVIPGAVEEVGFPDEESGVFDIPIEIDLDDALHDAAAATTDASATLRQTPLFSELDPPALERLIEHVELVELDEKQRLFRQGQSGSELYVVEDGEVAVVDEGPPRVTLATLGEGSFFGEIAVVTDQPRTATVEAVVPTKLLSIGRGAIADLVEGQTEVLKVLLRFLRDRLLDNLTRTNSLFAPFSGDEQVKLASKFRFLEVEPGAVVVEQGEKAKGLFIMLAGHAEVHRQEVQGVRRLATLGPGTLFGEMSLLSNSDAIATVKTTVKSFVLKLPASEFRELIMTHPQVLAYIGDLASERQRRFDAIVAGDAEYEEGHLQLL